MGRDNWRRFLWGATAYPLVWLGLLYLLVLRTRIAVGHWPYYSHPDPKDTGFDVHYGALLIGLVFIPYIGLLGSSFGLWQKFIKKGEVRWWLILAPVAMAALTISFLWIEPAGLMDWLMD